MDNKYALVTGAAGGIGFELARCAAGDGYSLIIVGSNEDRLKTAQKSLESEFPVNVVALVQDLSVPGSAEGLYGEVEKRGLDVVCLVNNAGFGTIGPAETIPLDKDERMLTLNVITPTELCKLFLPQMYQKHSGKILNIASTGAFNPGPYTGSYFASKSYVLSYTKALRYEAKSRGVQVSALCPGTTRTRFFEKEGMDTPFWAMSPESVARDGWRGLRAGCGVIVPGMMNKLIRLVPSGIKTFFTAQMKKSD